MQAKKLRDQKDEALMAPSTLDKDLQSTNTEIKIAKLKAESQLIEQNIESFRNKMKDK